MRIKESKGVLSIEATISLTMLIFIVMLILDIGFVYRAQNMVYHGMIQAAKSTSLIDYEVHNAQTATETSLDGLARFLEFLGVKEKNAKAELKRAIKSKDAPKVAQIAFKGSVAEKQDEAKDVLIDYNVSRISFKDSKYVGEDDAKDRDIVIVAEYDVKLLVPVFGVEKITLKQSATSRLWGRPEE